MEAQDYFERLINQQFENLHANQDDIKERLDKILEQTTITNGRVRELERWRATSQGHWSGVNKTMGIILTIIGIAVGAIITWQFH